MNQQKETDGEEYRWYIEPGNEHTNEVLSRDLSDFGHKKARLKGKIQEIPVWEANYAYVEYIQRSQKSDGNLEFKIFTQKKRYEKALLYRWPFNAAHSRKKPWPRKKVA